MPLTSAQYRAKAETHLATSVSQVVNPVALQTGRSIATTGIAAAYAYLYEIQKRIEVTA